MVTEDWAVGLARGYAFVAFAILVAVPLLCLIGTWLAIPLLRRIGAVDRPNAQSSHDRPVPRGGGIVPVVVFALFIAVAEAPGAFEPIGVVVAVMLVALAAIGLWDDVRRLSPWPRLAAHAVAVGAALAVVPGDLLVFQGLLGLPADRALAFVLWLWFVNLYNFMDGIDGLAAGQAVTIGAGLSAALLGFGDVWLDAWVGFVALPLATASLGFLRWNWPPAKVFLGDAGSVPLGYAVGGLLLLAAANGAWLPAAILPLYFVADATTTLVRGLARGRAPWRAHREHAYQVAVSAGRSHRWVTSRVLLLDLWLVVLAVAAAKDPGLGALSLALAFVSVGATLWYFRRQRPR
jgi:UDP-N-acetylmuramyl pentapeptide phosphotransferase/UDP-N-acetylglucosamine-1-phosphate transferase